MRPLSLMLIPVLLVSASGTRAQTLAPDDPVAVVQVKPMDGPCRLRNEQARQIAGTYEMNTTRIGRIFAHTGRRIPRIRWKACAHTARTDAPRPRRSPS